jgi:hypothetical protein
MEPELHANIHKFPRTRHILDAGGSGVARDDLVRHNLVFHRPQYCIFCFFARKDLFSILFLKTNFATAAYG